MLVFPKPKYEITGDNMEEQEDLLRNLKIGKDIIELG